LCPEPGKSLGERMHAGVPLLVGAGGADRHVRVRREEDEGEGKLSPGVNFTNLLAERADAPTVIILCRPDNQQN